MKLHYIYHSGFAIEAEGVTILIDYYKDASEADANRPSIVRDHLLHLPGKLYILSTHAHHDHFNRKVLEWREQRPDIRYILSKDILTHRHTRPEEGYYLCKGESYEDETLRVEAFGSTDIGSSFLISLQGRTLFHAGDLNNWHWSEESTEAEIRQAEEAFEAELTDIRASVSRVDVAMFPVDPRMGKGYMKGAQQFVEQICTGTFVPMHFGEVSDAGNAFRPFAEEAGCRFLSISHAGESFEI